MIGEWVGMEAVTLLARAQAQLGRGLEAAAVIEDHQSRRLRPPGARVDGAEVRGWAARFDRGLVTWSVGADSSVVVGVTAGGEAFAEAIPLGRRALLGAVRRLREAALAGDGERVRALAASVGPTLLPGAVGRHLGSGPPGGRVLFLVHGPLERLPLALLEIGAAPLDEVLTPLVLPGLPPRDDAPPPALGPGAHWRLMGSPLGLDGAPLLPGAEGELVHLARLHPRADLRVGAAFLRGALVEALAGRDPLHVATHLVPSPACGEGRLAPVGLVLSGGGVLCAEEILTLGPRLPLVVLTACETAGGRAIDGEGVHGVGRAFLEAGTRDLLVTLWPVEDGAARRFAVAFHEALGRGEPPSAAARSARRRLRAAGLTAADWAPFRLMGRD